MAEAQDILRAGGWDPEGVKEDLDPEGERRLAAHVRERVGHEFVFITHYPTSIRPFYHMRPAGQPDVTLSFDLLWKGLEVTHAARSVSTATTCSSSRPRKRACVPSRSRTT